MNYEKHEMTIIEFEESICKYESGNGTTNANLHVDAIEVGK